MIKFYNIRHYSAHFVSLPSAEPAHKRSNSTSAVILEDPALHPHPPPHVPKGSCSSSDTDVFPPRATLPYNPDGMIEFWLHEYEDVLGEVFGDADDEDGGAPGLAEKDDVAWNRLGEIMRSKGGKDEDVISDSESVVTVEQLDEGARLDEPGLGEEGVERLQRRQSGDENTWEVGTA